MAGTDFLGGLSDMYAAKSSMTSAAEERGVTVAKKDNSTLDFNDFLKLMVVQFQNQSMDAPADTADMMNQLVQMSVVQAVTNITDATTMMYAGSLVGKEVTVAGKLGSNGKFEEIVGIVTATGTLGGEQVIFVGDKSYKLSEIMAVGRLPEIKPPEEPDDKPDTGDKPDVDDKPDTGDTPDVDGGTTPDTGTGEGSDTDTGAKTFG